MCQNRELSNNIHIRHRRDTPRKQKNSKYNVYINFKYKRNHWRRQS